MAGVNQIAGNALTTAGLLTGNPAMAGAAFGAGQSMAENQGPVPTALNTAIGAAGGKVLSKAGELATSPEARQALTDYWRPGYKAAEASQQYAEGHADIKAQLRALDEQGKAIQEQKDALIKQRSRGIQGTNVKLQTLGEEKTAAQIQAANVRNQLRQQMADVRAATDAKVQTAEQQLNDAIKKNIPHLKNQVAQISKNMSATWDEVFNRALNGKEIPRSEWQNEVVRPLLEEMDADHVPPTSAIYKKLKAMLGEEAEEVKEPAGFGTPEAKPPTESDTGEAHDMLKAEDFKHLSKSITDSMSPGVKAGTQPAGLYDRWGNRFKGLQLKFIAKYDEDAAALYPDYARMARARAFLQKRALPVSEDDIDGSLKVMRDLATGDPLAPSTRANMVLRLEQGSGRIPGLGEGAITKPFGPQAGALREAQASQESALKGLKQRITDNQMTAADRQRMLSLQQADLRRQFAVERQGLTQDINDLTTKMKQLGTKRADVNKGREILDQLDIKRKRLLKISAWEKGFLTMGAGYALGRHEGVLPPIQKMMGAP